MNRFFYVSKYTLNVNLDASSNTTNPWLVEFRRRLLAPNFSGLKFTNIFAKNHVHAIAHLSINEAERNLIVEEANRKYKTLNRKLKKIAKTEFVAIVKHESRIIDSAGERFDAGSYHLKFKIKSDYVYLEEFSEEVIQRSSKLKKIK